MQKKIQLQLQMHSTVPIVIAITSLFTKLPWPGDSEGTFRSSSQTATCLPPAVEASHCPFCC